MTSPPLARSGVDRAALHRGDPQWLAAAWAAARVLVIDRQARVLCRFTEVTPREVTPQEGAPLQRIAGSGVPSSAAAGAGAGAVQLVLCDAAMAPEGERLFLGLDEAGTPYFAVLAELPQRADARSVTLREVGAVLPDREVGLLATAAALVNWHASHRYSPVTGEPTTVADGGWLRVDPTGKHLFPRTDPAVIVLVHDGVAGPAGRCLLGHNAAWRRSPGRRFYSTLAGFVEPGESAEAAVVREVWEEVGVRVSQLRYQGSQPWPFPGSLMLGFSGYADPAQPVRPDQTEIADARWFSRTEVAGLLSDQSDPAAVPPGPASSGAEVALPGPASIAHFLIYTWLHGRPSGAVG